MAPACALPVALAPPGLDPRPVLEAVAGFLVAVSAYWVAAALALLFVAVRRRRSLLEMLVSLTVLWLLLRGLGALLRLLVPCIAPHAESAFGFVVALGLVALLPLRLWQRGLCLAIVALMAGSRAYALRCWVPTELVLAVGAGLLALGLFWLLDRWSTARQLWQRLSLRVDNWGARQARVSLTPTLRAVLEARLQRHLGFTVEDLAPLGADGVHASTPLVLTGRTPDGRRQRYFVKIVSAQNWQTSMVYEAMRSLQHRGRIRPGPLWPSLKALVEREHYMLLLFSDLGVPVPRPRGVYRLERRVYALVTDYLEGARTLREVGPVPAGYVTQALEALRRLRQADCAHRDIKASNILMLPGEGFAMVDLAQADYIAGPKRLAKDLADLLVVIAMHHEPEAVVAIARDIAGDEGLRQARAYLHRSLLNSETQRLVPLDLPRWLRRLIRETGRPARP